MIKDPFSNITKGIFLMNGKGEKINEKSA